MLLLAAMTCVVLTVAILVGLLLKDLALAREWARTTFDDVAKVLRAIPLLAGLMVAVVLAGGAWAYGEARSAAKLEADAIDALYEGARYADPPFRQRLQEAATCYARAVAGPEWDALADGEGSALATRWADAIRRALVEMSPSATGFGVVQAADASRARARSERLLRAEPGVPDVAFGLMLLLLAMTLAGLVYPLPRPKNRWHIASLVTVGGPVRRRHAHDRQPRPAVQRQARARADRDVGGRARDRRGLRPHDQPPPGVTR